MRGHVRDIKLPLGFCDLFHKFRRPCHVARSLAVASVILGLISPPLHAQQKKDGTLINVPPGGKLRASVGEANAEVSVANQPKLVELRFGRMETGRFIPYSPKEPMPYDRPFMVQARFAAEPLYEQTSITLTTKQGERYAVPIYKTANPAVFHSQAMVFEDPSGCRGLKFCQP